MKTTILILALLFISCEIEPLGKSLQDGYLSFSGSIPKPTTFKAEVPECSEFTPNEVYYRLIRPIDGSIHTGTSPITINGNQIFASETMIFQEGQYQVDEVSLRYSGIITHSAPNQIDPRFDFAVYVDNPLPYDITILPGVTTTATDQVMCYTEEIIELDPSFEWVGEVVELQTMYFFVPESSCIEYITMNGTTLIAPDIIKSYVQIEIPILEKGLYSIPIPTNFEEIILDGYREGTPPNFLMETITITEYNADGVLDQDDILFFAENCEL